MYTTYLPSPYPLAQRTQSFVSPSPIKTSPSARGLAVGSRLACTFDMIWLSSLKLGLNPLQL
jgi:hypothetical protein